LLGCGPPDFGSYDRIAGEMRLNIPLLRDDDHFSRRPAQQAH